MVVRLLPRPQRTTRLWVPGDPSGLSRNGLVALYDPYRDVYGRNMLPTKPPTSAEYRVRSTVSGPYADYLGGTTAYRIAETEESDTHYWGYGGIVHPLGARVTRQIVLKSDGVRYVAFMFRLTGNTDAPNAVVDLATGTVDSVTQGDTGLTAEVAPLGGGWYRVTLSGTVGAQETNLYYGLHLLNDEKNVSYMGSTSRAVYISHMASWLSPVPLPYSAPSGVPSTLQTGADYSGHGNHLTLGANTNASTDDPAYTGTAWLFDGGDFMTAGRPAQLEVAQPWWGFGVYYLLADETLGTLVGKHNSALASTNPSNKGFFVRTTTTNKVEFAVYTESGSYTVVQTASPLSAGWHWISYGWDCASLVVEADQTNTRTVAMTTYAPDVTFPLTFGKYAYKDNIFLTGSIAMAGFYSRFPSLSERTRIALYVKNLMAQRGITLP